MMRNSFASFELGPVVTLPSAAIERPGMRRMRITLDPTLDEVGLTPEFDRSGRAGRRPTGWRSKSCGARSAEIQRLVA